MKALLAQKQVSSPLSSTSKHETSSNKDGTPVKTEASPAQPGPHTYPFFLSIRALLAFTLQYVFIHLAAFPSV